jgi:hypothetical protein
LWAVCNYIKNDGWEWNRDETWPFNPELLKETKRLKKLTLNLNFAMFVSSFLHQESLQTTMIHLLLEGMVWIIQEQSEDLMKNLPMFLIKKNSLTFELHQLLNLSEFE